MSGKESKGFFKEFQEFIQRGNVMDLAVAVVIGAAFTAIVTSLVNDIIMPLISLLSGGTDFSSLAIVLGTGENAAKLTYGNFIAAIINFFLIALVIFLVIRSINRMKDLVGIKKEEAPSKRVCPYCKQEIADDATRCPHCTSRLEGFDETKGA